ncbi:abhydrolase domain-containing protein 11 [Trypanosoma conorhini]|uniref:Abhydrolase domain-containing protein 11 n=1 Tax=Trypanosoma conorhini TaxID=83891 RepID=A0A3R7MHM8_9TRYP|nr:abhydrolase domain-containing protein 11 [Trypanosoma conorhini]RNF06057.1 abhydrolase domain-containing protein 11 [Trypanosoma conorhini]
MTSAVRLYSARLPSSATLSQFPPIRLIFLHGILAHGGTFFSLAQRLRKSCTDALPNRCLEMVMLDLRNHGRSPHAATHTLSDVVLDLQHWLEHEGHCCVEGPQSNHTASPILVAVGHSMGSLAWTKFLMDQQTDAGRRKRVRIDGFVSLDMPPLTGRQFPSSLQGELCDYVALMKRVDLSAITDVRSAFKEFDRCGIHNKRVQGFLSTNLQIVRPGAATNTKVAPSVSWRCNIPVLEETLLQRRIFFPEASLNSRPHGKISVPVLSLLGGKSPVGGSSRYRGMWSSFADTVEEHVLHDAGHNVYHDDLQGTAQLTEAFLTRLQRRHTP